MTIPNLSMGVHFLTGSFINVEYSSAPPSVVVVVAAAAAVAIVLADTKHVQDVLPLPYLNTTTAQNRHDTIRV